MKITLSLLSLFILLHAASQNYVDIRHYEFEISLNDTNDVIRCQASITGNVLKNGNELTLDLAEPDNTNDNRGMIVSEVKGSGVAGFKQANDKIIIKFQQAFAHGDSFFVQINYSGIPGDGLIISKSKFGRRTFFSDNWPNRAHYWIPCNDNPADKASVDFIVIAPSHYQVVSNGVIIEETDLAGDRKLTHWSETVPLPPKIMVIGATEFAVRFEGEVNCVPVYSWVYPENKENGFYDYAPAKEILLFFINYIGPYPFKKLANVQSKTMFAGMENASAIFYAENSVTGNRRSESTIAHEIAHQWFGDMATEKSFAHLWLSEGFATYLAHFYIESKYGTDSLNREMQNDKMKVISFAKNSSLPVVDSTSAYMDLLNVNSYQKGSWILHMLRRQLGDSVFHRIIVTYYDRFKGKNADTKDFQAIAEEMSGKKLDQFFRQWLYTPGIPQLKINWRWLEKEKKVQLNIIPLQAGKTFNFPFELELSFNSAKKMVKTLDLENKALSISWPAPEKPVSIIADPHTSSLSEVVIMELK